VACSRVNFIFTLPLRKSTHGSSGILSRIFWDALNTLRELGMSGLHVDVLNVSKAEPQTPTNIDFKASRVAGGKKNICHRCEEAEFS
jgi:hypothetical protein